MENKNVQTYSCSSHSQENTDLVPTSVVEELKVSTSQCSQQA